MGIVVALLACILSAVAGLFAGAAIPAWGPAVSISIIGAFIIYYLDKISKK